MKKYLLLALILIVGMGSAFAQSRFLEVGQSGIGATAIVQESYWEDGFMGVIGYSFKGIFDIDVGIGSFKYDHLRDDVDLKEIAWDVSLTWWPMRTRTGGDRGIDIGVWGSYEHEEHKSDSGKCRTGNCLAGGAISAINFDINDTWFLQPYYAVGYAYDETKDEITDDKEDYKGAMSSFGVSLVRRLANGSSFVITLETDSDAMEKTNDTAYELAIGYNFAF